MAEDTAVQDAPAADAPPTGQDAEGRSLAGLQRVQEAITKAGVPSASPAPAQPAGEPKGEGEPAGGEEPKAEEVLAKFDERLLKAAERVHLTTEQLAAMLPTLGEDGLKAMLGVHADALDEHAANLGKNGRDKKDEDEPPPAVPGETFALGDELRAAYGEHNADLMDGLEQGIRDQVLKPMQAGFKTVNESVAGLRGVVMGMLADAAIAGAGEVAKGLERKAVLEKANVIAAGLASTGKAVDPAKCLADALAQLTQPKAAEAARRELARKTKERSRQVQGPPSGRQAPPPTDKEGRKMQALKEVEQARQKHGLPPS